MSGLETKLHVPGAGKVNPWKHRRPERQVFSRTFVDPDFPEDAITLNVRKPNLFESGQANDLAKQYVEAFVRGGNAFITPDAQTDPEGNIIDPIFLSETVCEVLAGLEMMQTGTETERYTFGELVGLADRYPNAWREISDWFTSIFEGAAEEADPGNSQRAPTG